NQNLLTTRPQIKPTQEQHRQPCNQLLRHNYVPRFLEQGTDLQNIQALPGHRPGKTTKKMR
ncbi:hypothetical protein, partial [Maribellus luteus]|uniref:hypothetical protein n=1 Tax=Maribellus luteus TaxID=2305463 RepID=UPI0019D4A26F